MQESVDLKEVYRDALEGKEDEPMEHAAAPSNDSEVSSACTKWM